MTDSIQNRATSRRRVIKRGTLYFNNGRASTHCVIKNLSRNGAMIEVPGNTIPNGPIDLVLDNTIRFPGRIVWSAGNRMGVCAAA